MGNFDGTLREVAQKAADLIGVELAKVEYKRAGQKSLVRVVIHREGGTSIEDCERVSRTVERELDSLNLIPGKHAIEVMSRGITVT